MPDGDLTQEPPAGAEADSLSKQEVVVLQPGDERAQKIGKAIASQTANDILHMLQNRLMTATDLAESLKIPMGTVKYHIENLLDAGLLEVRERKYSVKGREVKVYGLKDQLLIVAPKVQNIRSILLKYASLFGIIGLASLAAYSFLPLVARTGGETRQAFHEMDGAGAGALNASAPATTPSPGDTSVIFQASKSTEIVSGPVSPPFPTEEITSASAPGANEACSTAGHSILPTPELNAVAAGFPVEPILAFFLGGCVVIAILLLYEVVVWRKNK
ncbi:MAG: helix-turn-helix domain-containing protein [Methanolinea sp.]|nr:helix-turn-helix domain-containing protein [Methanolinea sp.]